MKTNLIALTFLSLAAIFITGCTATTETTTTTTTARTQGIQYAH